MNSNEDSLPFMLCGFDMVTVSSNPDRGTSLHKADQEEMLLQEGKVRRGSKQAGVDRSPGKRWKGGMGELQPSSSNSDPGF